jgi:hypothetical protein
MKPGIRLSEPVSLSMAKVPVDTGRMNGEKVW